MVFVQMTARIDRLVFRGDSRRPDEIFRSGFDTKDHPDFMLASLSNADREALGRATDEERLAWKAGVLGTFFENYEEGRYREQQQDFAQESGVCCTLKADVAPMFPLLGESTTASLTWVYTVFVSNCFVTYKRQETDRSTLVYAREVATQHIDPRNVVCAIQCSRVGRGSNAANISHGVVFNYSGETVWNRMYCPANLRSYAAPIVDREFTPYMNRVHWGPGTQRGQTTQQALRLFPDLVAPPHAG